MKTQNTKLQFDKNSLVELNNEALTAVLGGTVSIVPIKECFLCINTSNGPGGTIIQQLLIA